MIGCGIRKLEDTPFHALHNLKMLNLSNCGLRALSRNDFAGLNNVRLLDLSYNSIGELYVKLRNLKTLLVLNISHNPITEMDSSVFCRNQQNVYCYCS